MFDSWVIIFFMDIILEVFLKKLQSLKMAQLFLDIMLMIRKDMELLNLMKTGKVISIEEKPKTQNRIMQ